MALATAGGEAISSAQVDAQIAPRLKAITAEYERQKFEARRDALDDLIFARLVAQQAAREHRSVEQLLQHEIEDRIRKPSDDEVREVFKSSQDRLPSEAGFDEYGPKIAAYLVKKQREHLTGELAARLRHELGVSIHLQEPRVAVEATGPSRGPANAPVTIIEFSDFECPYCGRARPTVEQVMREYPGQTRLVFRQFPLGFHPHAEAAAQAALCADQQGRFWDYHDLLFDNQRALERSDLQEYAQRLGLDTQRFSECLDRGATARAVERDRLAGNDVGVNGTPAFFINGRMLSGALPFDEFKRVIDQELLRSEGSK